MILVVCLDDKGGMMFNKRRQSKDAVVRDRILELTDGKKLWMNEYSLKQFENAGNIACDESFLDKASEGEYCFVEDKSLAAYEKKAEKIIIYKWNRVYPSDMKLDIDLSDRKLESIHEFAGRSHEKITEEVYIR